ncbi:MAG: glycosyltransferase [Desulfovibrio sp.]|nr:glycosyltransferase [Desulfovibrio sp.]
MDEPFIVFLHGSSWNKTLSCARNLFRAIPDAHIFAFIPEHACLDKIESFLCPIQLPKGVSWRVLANALFPQLAKDYPDALLLLWDSSFTLHAGSIMDLRKSLFTGHIAAAAPVWVRPGIGKVETCRVLNLGLAVDSQLFLHSLHEGIRETHYLTKRPRLFQIAFDHVLLVRLADCLRIGGFPENLDEELASLHLTLTLHRQDKTFVAVSPTVRVLTEYPFFSLALLGLWNSQQQRGRLPPNLLVPDYHSLLAADGMSLRIDSWLNEGPGDEVETSDTLNNWENAWLRYRLFPNPERLISFFTHAEEAEQKRLLSLCQAYPYYLPKAHTWYLSLASRILHFAKNASCPQLEEDLAAWEDKSTTFCKRILPSGMNALRSLGFYSAGFDFVASAYDAWQELVEPTLPSVESLDVGPSFPPISVLMPVYNPDPDYFREAIESLCAQTYGNWRLCMADDASSAEGTRDLLDAFLALDNRISCTFRTQNGHISRATNSALELVKTPYCSFMDQDDLLAPTALEETAKTLAAHPAFRYVFSDDDHIDNTGLRRTPYFKGNCDWQIHGTGHLSTLETQLIREVGGLRPECDGAQDYDFCLRVLEHISPANIGHIPRILYHWRIHPGSTAGSIGAKPYVIAARKRAIEESLVRRGVSGEICDVFGKRFQSVLLHPNPAHRVSVIFLATSAKMSSSLMKSLTFFGSTLNEVFWQPLAEDVKAPHMLSAFLQGHCPNASLQSLSFMGYSWQKVCTKAAERATSETLLFLSASLIPKTFCRPEQLAFLAQQENVSLVSGTVYQKDLIWDLGAFPDIVGRPFPLARGLALSDLPHVLTGTMLFSHRSLGGIGKVICTAVARSSFLAIGGFSEEMGNFAQIDYVLRAEHAGSIALTTPWGAWETDINDFEDKEKISPQKFCAVWGKKIATHPLRHPLLHAAEDNGWALL